MGVLIFKQMPKVVCNLGEESKPSQAKPLLSGTLRN